jgi:thymidylate synthase
MSGIPVLHVEADSIARAWEESLIELHHKGCEVKTQYDKPGDPPSKDATMVMTVTDPLKEPMIHKDFPGGPEDLQEYVMEVCEGIKDHLVRDPGDPTDSRWEYTYHQRLFAYAAPTLDPIDQIEALCGRLADAPHTRRAQAVTWKVWEDNTCYDPACLQSLWCRMKRQIAQRISELCGRPVRLGRYCHLADSYHIYGSYFREFETRFLRALEKRTFEQRTMRYEDRREIMETARPATLEKARRMGK